MVAEHRRCVVWFEDAAGGDGLAAEYWFKKAEKDGTIAPQRKLANEKPKGETVDYDALIKSWPATPPKRASN